MNELEVGRTLLLRSDVDHGVLPVLSGLSVSSSFLQKGSRKPCGYLVRSVVSFILQSSCYSETTAWCKCDGTGFRKR